jgi:hypothetical protein
MLTDAQCRRQDAEHQEWLRGRLVLDVVLDGVRQKQGGLEVDLRQNESEQDRRVQWLAEAVQVGGDAQLGEGDRARAYPLGRIDAERHRERLETERAVALDGLEVIHDRNAKPRNRVEDRTIRTMTHEGMRERAR